MAASSSTFDIADKMVSSNQDNYLKPPRGRSRASSVPTIMVCAEDLFNSASKLAAVYGLSRRDLDSTPILNADDSDDEESDSDILRRPISPALLNKKRKKRYDVTAVDIEHKANSNTLALDIEEEQQENLVDYKNSSSSNAKRDSDPQVDDYNDCSNYLRFNLKRNSKSESCSTSPDIVSYSSKGVKDEHDALLSRLGPIPEIVPSNQNQTRRPKQNWVARYIFCQGVVEEGDGLYEQPPHKDDDGSSGSDDGIKALQMTEGRIWVEGAEEPEGESSFSILLQVLFPFLIAGLGMVGAGLVLDIVQHWKVFVQVSEIFIMVPALLGLKGNLEMTLASRLSTHANMGHLDRVDDCISMIVGNLALIQCQAIVVGFLASVAAVVMGWIPEGHFDMLHAILLCAGALVTASFASFILGVIMVIVILLSRKWNINPDNVSTPIAASLGDLITLGLLAWIASLLYESKLSEMWLSPVIIFGYLLSLPLWIWLASRNRYTKEVLYSGWTPVISAMVISSMGGVILDYAVSAYKGIAVYQPVINGVGGNLVAVQASRISTALHLSTPLGRLPRYVEKICLNPFTVLCTNRGYARTSRMLLLLVVPGHLIFVYTISYLKAGHTSLTPIFLTVYLCAALLQVVVLLYMSVIMVHWMWKLSINPDNSAIPYLTAFGDLIGTGLLASAFHLLYLVGDKDSDLGD